MVPVVMGILCQLFPLQLFPNYLQRLEIALDPYLIPLLPGPSSRMHYQGSLTAENTEI